MDSEKGKGAVSAHKSLKSFIKIFCFPHACDIPSTYLERERESMTIGEKNTCLIHIYKIFFYSYELSHYDNREATKQIVTEETHEDFYIPCWL